MDRTEKKSAELSQSEASDSKSDELDRKKSKSIGKDSADGKSNEIVTEVDPPDSTETGQINEKDYTAEHPTDDPDPQATRDTGEEESDQTDMNAATAGKGDDSFSEGDEITPDTEAQDVDHSEPVDSDLDTNEQPSQSLNNITDDERVAADSVFETSDEDEHDTDQPQIASKKASEPQADDAVIEASTPDSQDSVDQEEADLDAAEQATETVASKTSIVKIAVSAVLITALFSGFFIFENKSKMKKDKTVAEALAEDRSQPFKSENKQIMDILSAVTPNIYDDPINEVSILRDTLLKKQAEVLALKKRYRQSIEELEKEILDAQRKADVQTFLQATSQNHIVFSLKTIQRRQAYIRQLEKPLEWVSGACEELLYLKRRVMTDLQVSAIASGIDMDGHVQQMHRALKEYRPTADKLAIDPTDARLESLETIWQRIQDKQDIISVESVYSKNQIISAQICAGDFSRIGELSEITTATAKCITEMQASDLFLNQITEISPAAARQLCQWKGSWICINGIRALSPRAAHYLFQWDGHWISLNGLKDFPAEIGEALLRWPGRQLELMGLLDTADSHARIGIEYLAEWERSGGKLFVPKNLRKKIDALHQQSG